MTKKSKPPFPLEGLSPEVIDAILRNDLGLMMRCVVWPELKPHEPLVWAPFLDLMCAKLQAVADGKTNRLIVTVPPRFGKSMAGSVTLPAYFLGKNPSAEVMCISYSAELAKEFGQQTRKVVLSADYQRLFETRLVSDKASPMLLRTTQGGGRRATSIDGTATGLGGHLLVFDDPQKPGEMLSEAIRRSTNSAYENTFLSRQNDPQKVRTVIIQQRTHEDDFVGHVTGLGGGDNWTIVNLPAIAEADEAWPYETFLGEHVWIRKEGESLHPDRFPVEELMKIRASVGESTWSTQWQQRPTPAGGGIVQVKWFRLCPFDQLPQTFDRVIQSWDTANTTAEWSDYSVCTTWGIKENTVYLRNVFRKRLLYPDLKRAVLEEAAAFNAVTVLIENRASGQQLLQDLIRDGFTKAQSVDPDRDKQMRMASQTAIIENGFVVVPEGVAWAREYIYEMEVFPNGKYDDQVDSTSQFFAWFNNYRMSGWGVFEFYRQEAERVRNGGPKAMATVRVPPDMRSHTFILRDGKTERPDAAGCIRSTVENLSGIMCLSGVVLVDDDEAA